MTLDGNFLKNFTFTCETSSDLLKSVSEKITVSVYNCSDSNCVSCNELYSNGLEGTCKECVYGYKLESLTKCVILDAIVKSGALVS